MVRKAIFLDRDGTIIRNYLEGDTAVPLRTLDEFEILPQVKLAVDLLSSSSFNIVVVTNQPDVARGKTGLEFVQTVNDLIKEKLNIQYFYVCPHDNDDLCTCRKPKAGMIFEAASDLDLSIEDSFLIGDSWKDLAAAEQAGCKSFWVRNDGPVNYEGDYTAVDSLYEAAVMILGDQ